MPVKPITTKVNLSTDVMPSADGKTPPNMFAYVFSSNGRLLAQQPLEQGQSALEISAKEGSRVSVFVGPEISGEPTRAALRRRGAVVNDAIVSERGLNLKIPVGVDIWSPWLAGLCLVQGSLLKHVQFGPLSFNLPVPNALVEIYEVDPLPLIIWRLPDDLLRRLREYVLRPIPFPEPPEEIFDFDPFPPMDFDPIPPRPLSVSPKAGGGMAAAAARHAVANSATMHKAMSAPIGSQSMAANTSGAQVTAANMSGLQFMAANASNLQFRQALIENAVLVRPLLCLLFPINITMTQVATATTDECGHFQTFFFKGINNPDQPDLYFRARQKVFPFPLPMITIYAPTPVSCYTHWNYQCGTEVTLVTNNTLAIAKTPCIDLSDGVIVDRVGDISLADIRGTSTTLQPTTTPSNRGLTSDGRPWGSTLRLRLEFDPDLPTTDVKYYRVSYKRSGSVGESVPMNGAVTWTAVKFNAGGEPIYGSYDIGPKTAPNETGNLYEIHSRGNDAPNGLGFWSPQGSGGVVANNTNAIFDTTIPAGAVPAALPDRAGLFDIIVELFNANGDPVNLAAEDITFYVPPSATGDTEADAASTLGLMQGNKFVFQLFIDNNPPVVEVQEPHIGTQGAGTCGALEYSDMGLESVVVPHIAGQRNGFATYSFSIIKGHSDVRLEVADAPTGPNSHTLVRTASDGIAHLLDGCTVAGLRATASVSPTATTGWGPVHYNVSDTYSFALAPLEEEDD